MTEATAAYWSTRLLLLDRGHGFAGVFMDGWRRRRCRWRAWPGWPCCSADGTRDVVGAGGESAGQGVHVVAQGVWIFDHEGAVQPGEQGGDPLQPLGPQPDPHPLAALPRPGDGPRPGGLRQVAGCLHGGFLRRVGRELLHGGDPGFAALALFAAAAAPAILPHVARELTGLDPESDEFSSGYAEHLARLVRCLRDQPARPTVRRPK